MKSLIKSVHYSTLSHERKTCLKVLVCFTYYMWSTSYRYDGKMSNWPITKLSFVYATQTWESAATTICSYAATYEDRHCLIRYIHRTAAACWKSISLIFHISSLTWFFRFSFYSFAFAAHFLICHHTPTKYSHSPTNRSHISQIHNVCGSTMSTLCSPLICNFTLHLHHAKECRYTSSKLSHLIQWWCSY